MLKSTKLRELLTDAPSQAGGHAHAAAASGLVRAGRNLYVALDDELHLGVFSLDADGPGSLVRVFDGELPAPHAARKRAKPDLEALVHLGPAGLLAVPSGSTTARTRGALLALDPAGALTGQPPQAVDFAPLFGRLAAELPALNLEGAAVCGETLRLLQRGNNAAPSGVVELSLAKVLERLAAGAPIGPDCLRQLHLLDLGRIEGVALTPTDACALPDGRMVLSAVCEDTSSTYDDGSCVAAAVVVLDGQLRVSRRDVLEDLWKVEGLDARPAAGGLELLMVADADDPARPSPLLQGFLAEP